MHFFSKWGFHKNLGLCICSYMYMYYIFLYVLDILNSYIDVCKQLCTIECHFKLLIIREHFYYLLHVSSNCVLSYVIIVHSFNILFQHLSIQLEYSCISELKGLKRS